MSGNEIAVGNKAPWKLKHLNAQVKEALLSSEGQQGMSLLSDIDMLIGHMETPAPPVTGETTSEMPMRTAKKVRVPIVTRTIGRCKVGGQRTLL